MIDICINRQESQKVVDNYFVGTNDNFSFQDILKTFSSSNFYLEIYKKIFAENKKITKKDLKIKDKCAIIFKWLKTGCGSVGRARGLGP